MKASGSTYRTVAIIISILGLCYFAYTLNSKWGGVMTSMRLFMSSGSLIICEFILMIIGIIVETLRWSFIRKVFTDGDTSGDFIATLRAVALGNSTPANLGEHVGRGISYESKKLATEASICSSVIQTAVIVLVGFAGALYIAHENGDLDLKMFKVIFAIFLVIAGVCIYCVKYCHWAEDIKEAISKKGAWPKLTAATMTNIFKFCLFSFQYALLLSFGAELTMLLFCHVLFYYVCITFIPRLNIIDIGVKGALSIHMFSSFNTEEIITSAALLLWGINIIIPTVAGYVTIFIKRRPL